MGGQVHGNTWRYLVTWYRACLQHPVSKGALLSWKDAAGGRVPPAPSIVLSLPLVLFYPWRTLLTCLLTLP